MASRTGRLSRALATVPGSARRGDIVLAALLTPVLLVATAGAHWHGHRPAGVAGYLLVVAAGAGLAWRRAAPTTVLLWAFACTMTYGALGYAGGPVYVALIIAFVTAVQHGDRRVAYAVLAAGFVVSAYLIPLLTEGRIGSLTSQAALAGWLAALAALPELARVAGRARVEQARRHAGEERLRMAQDLHDVLAHQLALITVSPCRPTPGWPCCTGSRTGPASRWRRSSRPATPRWPSCAACWTCCARANSRGGPAEPGSSPPQAAARRGGPRRCCPAPPTRRR